MKRFYGIGLILISATAFGAMPVFARFAYQGHLTPSDLLFYRFAIAFCILVPLVRMKGEPFAKGRDLVVLMAVGALGYGGMCYCYFTALTLIPAAMVAVLLYLYPVLVVLFSTLFLGHRMTRFTWTALGLAMAGTLMVVGLELGVSPRGIFLGALSALFYAMYILTGAKVMERNPVLPSVTVVIGSAGALYGLQALVNGLTLPPDLPGLANVLALALISTVIAIFALFKGISLAGPVNGAMISTFEPVSTVFFCFVLFGQPVTPLQMLGTGLVLASAVVVALTPSPKG